MKTTQELYDWLDAYIQKNGGQHSQWYAGIASDPKARLFSDHNVIENGGAWAFDWAASDDDARAVEQALLKLGCDGGSGGGSYTTRAVYVYKKTISSNP